MNGAWRVSFTFGVALLMAFSRFANAQDLPVTEQVQAVISGLRTPQEALMVDRQLGHVPCVLLTRTDLHTSNLYMLVRASSPDQEEAVRASLARMGLHLGCWTRTPRIGEPFTHLDPARCDELPSVK